MAGWHRDAAPIGRYNGEQPETLVPAEQYGALLLLARASAPRFLS